LNVGIHFTEEESKIIEALKRPGERPSDVLRRALRSLEREEWRKQAEVDMEQITASGENLADEPDDWGPGANSR
jgi:Arc/MetJ-type ribon-helix-helix transcriptional regulator